MEITKLAIVGAGRMGSGIAQTAAAHGLDVILFARNPEKLQKSLQGIAGTCDKAISKGRMTEEEKADCLAHITATSTLGDVAAAQFVIEAIAEDLEVKQEMFGRLDEICPPDVIFASNTSSIPISSLALGCERPDRFIGTHFFSPVPVMKLVEVIRGLKTSDATAAAALELVAALGKTGVTCTDTPGFLVNRLLYAFRAEAYKCLKEGVASVEDIDTAVKLGLNHPMGPFELNDFSGLDVGLAGITTMYEVTKDPKWAPDLTLTKLVEAGDLGRKTGKGWYDYTDGTKKPRGDIKF